MDKLDAMTNYTQRLLDGYDKGSDLNESMNSDDTMKSHIAVQEMFGNAEVSTHSGTPVKGRRYLFFTVLMVIILSIVVVMDARKTTAADYINSAL